MEKKMSALTAAERKFGKVNVRDSLRTHVEALNTPNQSGAFEHDFSRGKNKSSKREHFAAEGQKEEGRYQSV
jgi:hypothetical protein